MVGASVIDLDEKDDKFVAVVEVSAPRLAPDNTKRVNAKLKAIGATGLIRVPEKVFHELSNFLSIREPIDESAYEGIRIAEVVSKGSTTNRGVGGSVTRYTVH